MTDIASISAGFAGIKQALDIVKFLKDTDLSLDKAQTKHKIADLTNVIVDLKIHLAEIKEELIGKNTQIRDLQEKLNLKGNMKFERPVYFSYDNNSKDGPFCAQCYDAEGKLIRLTPYHVNEWTCKTCRNFFE